MKVMGRWRVSYTLVGLLARGRRPSTVLLAFHHSDQVLGDICLDRECARLDQLSGSVMGYGRSPNVGNVGLSKDLLQSYDSNITVDKGCAGLSGRREM